jgi:hypothetical protein
MNKYYGPLAVLLAVALALPAAAQVPPPPSCPAPPIADLLDSANAFGPGSVPPTHAPPPEMSMPERGCLQSDYAFPTFVGPISNPFLSKDPRSLTELRLVFINNEIPTEHPLHGGDFQMIGAQARVALTDRLTFIADKSGYAWIHPGIGGETDGFLNVAAGLKYLIIRDVSTQFLWSVGAQFEPQTGEGRVFQNQGDGVLTGFTTVGKQFGCWHFLGTGGYQFPMERDQGSSFYYVSLHLDRQFFHFLYPLVEVNWFHYDRSGDRGIPPEFGEGDGLINLGTSGVTRDELVTMAVGLKAAISPNLETGAAWEFPISSRKDLIDNRITFEVILRY